MTFAVVRSRSRNRLSGTSGDATFASIPRNASRSTTDAPSRPSVCADVQPAWFPFTIAYTAHMSAAVTVTAPATSSRTPAGPRPDGSSTKQNANTAMPTGRLTMKIQCQSSTSVRMPPRSTPTVPPPAATKPKTPMAFARSPGSVNMVMISESETAETIAPPRPCTARATISRCWVLARPHASDASVKSAIPIRNSRRCPNRSPRRPPSSRKPPKVSR